MKGESAIAPATESASVPQKPDHADSDRLVMT